MNEHTATQADGVEAGTGKGVLVPCCRGIELNAKSQIEGNAAVVGVLEESKGGRDKHQIPEVPPGTGSEAALAVNARPLIRALPCYEDAC